MFRGAVNTTGAQKESKKSYQGLLSNGVGVGVRVRIRLRVRV
jgi:hypothetical protein